MTKIFPTRFLSVLASACLSVFLPFSFALTLALSFQPLAVAVAEEHSEKPNGETKEGAESQADQKKDKVQRKLERAKRLEEKGKIKKSRKALTKAIIAEYEAHKKYERALKLKKKGKFKKYRKKIKSSAKLGSEDAVRELMGSFDDDASSTDDPPVPTEEGDERTAFSEQEAYALMADALVAETLKSPYSDEAKRGDPSSLYKIGRSYQDSLEGVEKDLSAAFAMFLHAEKWGSGQASNALSLLLPELTIDEVAVGRDIYKEWKSIIKKTKKLEKKEKELKEEAEADRQKDELEKAEQEG